MNLLNSGISHGKHINCRQFLIPSVKFVTTLLLGWVFLMVIDPPFFVYLMYTELLGVVGTILHLKSLRLHSRQVLFFSMARLILYFGVFYVIYGIVSKFEVQREDLTYTIDMTGVEKSAMFFAMKADVSYFSSVKQVIAKMNKNSKHVVQDVNVVSSVWVARALQLDFILRYWSDPDMTSDYACIVESDVALNMDFFDQQLHHVKPELAHIHHFWAKRDFEGHNTGVFCASKTVSSSAWYWVKIVNFLNTARYIRLVPFNLLITFMPNKHVFIWDRDGGCTSWRKDCNYIHFTHPKDVVIRESLESLQESILE